MRLGRFGDTLPLVAPATSAPTVGDNAAIRAQLSAAIIARNALCQSEQTRVRVVGAVGAVASVVLLPGAWKILGLAASGLFVWYGTFSPVITPDCSHGF